MPLPMSNTLQNVKADLPASGGGGLTEVPSAKDIASPSGQTDQAGTSASMQQATPRDSGALAVLNTVTASDVAAAPVLAPEKEVEDTGLAS